MQTCSILFINHMHRKLVFTKTIMCLITQLQIISSCICFYTVKIIVHSEKTDSYKNDIIFKPQFTKKRNKCGMNDIQIL